MRVKILDHRLDHHCNVWPMNDIHEMFGDKKSYYGTFDKLSFNPQIDMELVSHQICNFEISNVGMVYGELKILETPHGKLLQDFLNTGCLALNVLPIYLYRRRRSDSTGGQFTVSSMHRIDLVTTHEI